MADSRVFARRGDVEWAEPDWRIIRLNDARNTTFGQPPLTPAIASWRTMRADLDRDGDIDGQDLDLLTETIVGGNAQHRFDLNGDGRVDMRDFAWAAERLTVNNLP